MATAEETVAELDRRTERRLEEEAEAHEAEIEEMHKGERLIRFSDLDGNYKRPETHFNWEKEDKLPRQLAAVAEWPAKEVRKFRAELEAIEEDGRFSDEFKEEKKRELAEEWLNQTNGAAERGGALARTRHDINRLVKKVEKSAPEFRVAPEPDPSDAVSAVREMEYRGYLQSLEGDQLRRTRRQWAHSDDPVKVRAVFGGDPGMAGYATEEGREALRREVIRKKYGNEPEEVEALRGLADLARHNLEQARSEIARLGGLR